MRFMIENRMYSMIVMNESGLQFSFHKGDFLVKFDDTTFYRNYFNSFIGAKGVDFIYWHRENGRIYFIEVKNCKGHESENRWRICPNDRKLKTAAIIPDSDDRHSLDIEMAQKVAMTMACLAGADTFKQDEKAKEYVDLQACFQNKEKSMIYVVLILEGDFSSRSRSKKMIMSELKQSIERKVHWLNCKVIVEDMDTHDDRDYSINKLLLGKWS